jgi:uncharacterized membrane protein (UPF0182 family)
MLLAVLVILLLAILFTLVNWTAELLWYRSLGYEAVFWRLRFAKLGMFAAVFFPVFGFLLINLRVLDKIVDLRSFLVRGARPGIQQAGATPSVTGAAAPAARLPRRVLVLASAMLAALFGLDYYDNWDQLIRFAWSQSFAIADPIYHRDIGFYVFILPFLNLVQGGLVLLALGALLFLGLVYHATGALRISPTGRVAADRKVLLHLTANGVLLLGAAAWGFYLDRYGLLTRSSGTVFGAGYADIHARLPGLWVTLGATLALIAGLIWAAFAKALRLSVLGVAGYLVIVMASLLAIPWGLQRFTVEPNELALETPFLKYNIAATRMAYGLDGVDVRPFPFSNTLDPGQLQSNQATIDNIRIWDDRPLGQTFRQLQQIRTYYSFSNVTVDRYSIDGQYRQVMLAARELSADLPGRGSSWVNEHLQYTHGFGLAMCFAAEKDDQGGPVFTVSDLPPKGSLGLTVTRPEIYYGAQMTNYEIVATGVKEFDYPQGDQNVYSSYVGHGDVLLDSPWKKTLFALYELDTSIVLSSYLSADSRIQIWRPIQERIAKLAPFLRLDRDPYLVIDQGRLFWIQDAYTTADGFPYSEPTEDGFSYIRNSVKVVVDAYEGDVRFYAIDPADPVLRSYSAAFPGVFRPLEEMPAGLRQHLRYPRDLFEIQVDKYNTYHMTVPQVFYNREDVWVSPKERYGGDIVPMDPYYVLMKLPGEDRLQFLLMTPVTPNNRDNMIAWIAARSDFPGYGELLAFKLSKDSLIYGPLQVEATIDQDTTISRQLSLWDQHGSHVIRGNLLVIPIDHSFLYIEPVFLLAEGTNIPQLKRVIVSDGTHLAMESTLAESLAVVFGERPSTSDETAGNAAPAATGAREAFAAADQALRRGDWGSFGKAWDELKGLLEK